MKRIVVLGILAAAMTPIVATEAASAKSKALVVCKRGCKYKSIQKAVNKAKKGQTIKVKPGKYIEGVIVSGHKKDRIKILGQGLTPRDTIIEGKGAKSGGNAVQNAVFVDGADNVTIKNLWGRNFAGNGFFVKDCNGYTMDHLVASFDRSYGLYAFNCKGGRMTYSEAYGHGDSGFYVGETPVQASNPKTTLIDHDTSYENVLGFSGTNSKYMDIRDSEFYNNGAGVAPNTLKSEKYPPSSDSVLSENLVYWNNFNYFKKSSPVKPLSPATGGFNYPTGVGVVLFGTTNWKVRSNLIFGNFKWGVMSISDPTYAPATNHRNQVTYNVMGAAFSDANGEDFWTEGTGSGNCWDNNSAGATYDQGSEPQLILYPKCTGNPINVQDTPQVLEAAAYLVKGETQEDSWKKHSHPKRPDRKPIDGQ